MTAPPPGVSPDRRPCGRRSGSRRPSGHPARGEGGAAIAELLFVLPAVLVLFGLGVQLALWALAAHALDDAVAAGGAAWRDRGGTAAQATTAVESELAAIAGRLVLRPKVTLRDLGYGEATISASGAVPSVLPGFVVTVSATSTGPVAQFRASG